MSLRLSYRGDGVLRVLFGHLNLWRMIPVFLLLCSVGLRLFQVPHPGPDTWAYSVMYGFKTLWASVTSRCPARMWVQWICEAIKGPGS